MNVKRLLVDALCCVLLSVGAPAVVLGGIALLCEGAAYLARHPLHVAIFVGVVVSTAVGAVLRR